MKTDKTLRAEAESALDSEPPLNAAYISVAVKDGVVTLRGHVSSVAEKELAESTAKRLGNVRAVADELEVTLPDTTRHTDQEIAEACLNAFDANYVGVLDEKIKIVVSNGWVTAEGQVSWQFQKNAALKAIRKVAGIKGVIDHIIVKQWVLLGDVKTELKCQSRSRQLSTTNRF